MDLDQSANRADTKASLEDTSSAGRGQLLDHAPQDTASIQLYARLSGALSIEHRDVEVEVSQATSDDRLPIRVRGPPAAGEALGTVPLAKQSDPRHHNVVLLILLHSTAPSQRCPGADDPAPDPTYCPCAARRPALLEIL